jgi:transcriptional regulator with PAS, ATPase and Fis domain
VSTGAASALERYGWPGNVRELKHVVERAVMSLDASRDELRAADLPLELFEDQEQTFQPVSSGLPTLDEVERRYIELVLRQVKDNQGEASRILGISRKALWEKRRRYGFK